MTTPPKFLVGQYALCSAGGIVHPIQALQALVAELGRAEYKDCIIEYIGAPLVLQVGQQFMAMQALLIDKDWAPAPKEEDKKVGNVIALNGG
jgi:cephalosporin hydroxylase